MNFGRRLSHDAGGAFLDLLLLTAEPNPDVVLPSLSLLAHTLRTAPPDVSSLLEAGSADILIVDARLDLPAARGLCRLLGSTGRSIPVVVVVNEGGLVAVNADWGLDEILLPGTGPAEIDARLRLLSGRRGNLQDQEGVGKISLGELVIDEGTYTARLRGRPLDLTYKEFELLKYLAQHAGRVFTRAELLREIWGYDFFGGPRTVDVHVRRLRAKLGAEYESLIGTVRNVGYKAVSPARAPDRTVWRTAELVTRGFGGTVTLVEKWSGTVGFGVAAMKRRSVVHLSGNDGRGDFPPD